MLLHGSAVSENNLDVEEASIVAGVVKPNASPLTAIEKISA
jgi:hypothetical protein